MRIRVGVMYIIRGPNLLLGVHCSCILHAHSSDKQGVLDMAFWPDDTVIFERVQFDDVVNRTNLRGLLQPNASAAEIA